MGKKSTKLLIGGLLSLGAYALLSKPKSLGSLSPSGALLSSVPLGEVIGTIQRVARDLAGQISQASSLTGTPGWLINAISAHEIRWKPYTFINPSVRATGPMQMTPPTMFDTYFFALKFGLVTPALEQYMRQALGSQYTKFLALAKDRKSDASFSKYLLNPQFNVVMGALLLRCLMQIFTRNGVLDQAKVALGYNRGIGYATKNMVGSDYTNISVPALIAKAPSSEAKAYIRDMVGVGGYFDHVHTAGV